MLVSNLFFQPKRALMLALSITFLSGQLVVATPDEVTPSTQSASKAADDNNRESQKNSTASAKTADESPTPSSGATIDDTSVSSEQGNAEQSAEPETSSSTTDDTTSGTAQVTAEELPDAKHDQGIRHWSQSKRYMKDWDLDLAQTELDLAIMDYPDLKIAHRDLCIVSLLKLNFWRSVAEFMMTVGLCEPVPMTPEEAHVLKTDSMVKHYKKGMQWARSQDWVKAVTELELASDLIPDDFAVQRSLAYGYANLGNFAKAEEHYQRTFELAPHDGSSRADLAYILAQNGKVQEAQKEMEEAVKSQPKAAAYHVDLAYMAESRGDLETAKRELGTAVTLSPSNADLWSHLGKVLEQKGNNSDAINAYLHAVSINPDMMSAKESLTRLQSSSNVHSSIKTTSPTANTAPI